MYEPVQCTGGGKIGNIEMVSGQYWCMDEPYLLIVFQSFKSMEYTLVQKTWIEMCLRISEVLHKAAILACRY